jgi:CheY-like chemotaxis protein
MSETPCILVVGADEVFVSTTVGALRREGRCALGTSDAWEAMQLVTERPIDLIVRDLNMESLGAVDFNAILANDPVLKDTPTIYFAVEGDPSLFRQEDLLAAIRELLPPRFPSEGSSRGDTRFVRRSRPAHSLPRPVPAGV